MSSKKKSSTKKSVNRARKTNGNDDKSRLPSRKGSSNKGSDSAGMPIAMGKVFRNDSQLSYVVPRRELVAVLSTTDGSFQTIKRLRCNPASEATFPWLSQMATLFEFYRFRRLAFEVVTRLPTTEPGSTILSPDYDAADGQLALSEQSLFSNQGSIEAPVWQRTTRLALSPQSMNRLYKSHTCMSDGRFATTKQDQKTVDVAQVFVCGEGTSGAKTIGKLIVDYEVEFFNPQFPTESPSRGGSEVLGTSFVNTGTIAPFADSSAVGVPGLSSVLKAQPTTASATGTLGQFTKDFTGFTSTLLGGSGFVGTPEVWVGDSPGAVDLAKDVLQASIADLYTGSSTGQSAVHQIAGLMGQYLKYRAPTNTTINHFAATLGGSAPYALLV